MTTALSKLGLVMVSIGAASSAVWSPSARSNDREWRAGLARVVITPDRPIVLGGYRSGKLFEKVETDLFAKAMALEDRHGRSAILVTTDLVGLPAAVARPIFERICQANPGLHRDQILLNSSHTHTGPRLSLDLGCGDENARNTVRYTRWVQAKIVEAASEALSRLKPARLSWGQGVTNIMINRRSYTADGVRIGVNPRGFVDRTVPVLRVESPEGQLQAVLFGCACHNTTLTGKHLQLCGDYAGFAQMKMEDRFPGVVAMFMAGCGGDANPHPRGEMEFARAHGATLATEVCRVLQTELQPVSGPLQTKLADVALPLQDSLSAAQLQNLLSRRIPGSRRRAAQEMLARLQRGEPLPSHYTCPVALWQFGSDLTLVALPGEVVVEYVCLIERAIGPLGLWVSAYNNDVFGYLPTARILREGGLESQGIYKESVGFFAPATEKLIVNTVQDLARQAGRRSPAKTVFDDWLTP